MPPKSNNATLKVNKTISFFLRSLTIEDLQDCASVLSNGKKGFSQPLYEYFQKGFLGFGAFNLEGMVGYVFIKNPKERPETLSMVLPLWRGLGIASALRDFAIESSKKGLVGDFVYSATELTNESALKSLLRSGFEIVEITGTDKRYIQLRKAIKI